MIYLHVDCRYIYLSNNVSKKQKGFSVFWRYFGSILPSLKKLECLGRVNDQHCIIVLDQKKPWLIDMAKNRSGNMEISTFTFTFCVPCWAMADAPSDVRRCPNILHRVFNGQAQGTSKLVPWSSVCFHFLEKTMKKN